MLAAFRWRDLSSARAGGGRLSNAVRLVLLVVALAFGVMVGELINTFAT